MKNYKSRIILTTAVLILAVLSGCSKDAKKSEEKDTISEGAKNIITTITTCPNTDLYNEDMFTHIGLGAEVSKEDREKAEAAYKKGLDQWEETIGGYFAPKGLNSFMDNGSAMYFLSKTAIDKNMKAEPVQMELMEKSDTSEKVKVTVDVNGTEEKVTVEFRYDKDGLIWKGQVLMTE